MAQLIEAQELADYADFLNSHPHAYLTQSVDWPKVKQGWRVHRFISRDSAGKTQGTAQVLTIADQKNGTLFAYVPRGPVTQMPPSSSFEVTKELLSCIKDHVRNLSSGQSSRILVDPQWYDTEENVELLRHLADFLGGTADVSAHRLQGQPKLCMILDLRPFDTYEDWLSALASKHRYYIRRTAKVGIQAYVSTDRKLVEDLYHLIEMTSDRQEISHRPKQYFYNLFDAFEGAFFSVAEHEGEKLSISLNVACGDTVHNLYAGNDLSKRNLRAPMAMNPKFIEEAFARGHSYVDFGGVFGDNTDDGLYAFKIQFMPGEQDVTTYAGEIQILQD